MAVTSKNIKTIDLRGESLAFMPSWGLAMAAAALVGQALGARKPKVAEAGIRRTLVMRWNCWGCAPR